MYDVFHTDLLVTLLTKSQCALQSLCLCYPMHAHNEKLGGEVWVNPVILHERDSVRVVNDVINNAKLSLLRTLQMNVSVRITKV